MIRRVGGRRLEEAEVKDDDDEEKERVLVVSFTGGSCSLGRTKLGFGRSCMILLV